MTKKQKRFVEEYLIDLNATQAAIRAGYSPDTAQEQSSRLLSNVMIKAAVDQEMAERSKRTGINADRIVRELAKIALVNTGKVINVEDATIRDDATDDDLAAVQSVKVKKSYSETGEMTEREVRMSDKVRALELLGRHLGMWNDKLQLYNLDAEKSKLDNIIEQMRGEE